VRRRGRNGATLPASIAGAVTCVQRKPRLAARPSTAGFCSWKGATRCIATGCCGPIRASLCPCGLLPADATGHRKPNLAAGVGSARGVGVGGSRGPGPSTAWPAQRSAASACRPAEHRTLQNRLAPGVASWLPAQSALEAEVFRWVGGSPPASGRADARQPPRLELRPPPRRARAAAFVARGYTAARNGAFPGRGPRPDRPAACGPRAERWPWRRLRRRTGPPLPPDAGLLRPLLRSRSAKNNRLWLASRLI